ncbi:MAG: hypothetical protein ACRC3Y_18675 [Romboutsia sp.]|uniref:hypothetical protein n=1 Tax=Romboutsia sp. TaxID=1965302 RepID=UPI003F397BAE
MKFECFYYPTLDSHGAIVKCNKNLRDFNFGDKVPTKTLYYNYGNNFAIYQDSEFIIVEDGILTKTITSNDLKFPLKIVFGKGTQLKIFSSKDLVSIRLLLKGEFEKEKELGELFCLSFMLNRMIKNTQYEIMSDLTNSSRDYNYINEEIDLRTGKLLEELKIVESKFYNLTIENPDLKDSYLNYMNFSNKEDMLELSINKYFKEGTDEYNYYILTSSVWKSKPIYPKFKLDNLINAYNYRD